MRVPSLRRLRRAAATVKARPVARVLIGLVAAFSCGVALGVGVAAMFAPEGAVTVVPTSAVSLAVGIAQKGLETEVPEMEHGDYGRPDLLDLGIDWNGLPELSDLAVGRGPKRRDNQEVTCFLNPIGFGMQFAAVGARLVEKSQERWCRKGTSDRLVHRDRTSIG